MFVSKKTVIPTRLRREGSRAGERLRTLSCRGRFALPLQESPSPKRLPSRDPSERSSFGMTVLATDRYGALRRLVQPCGGSRRERRFVECRAYVLCQSCGALRSVSSERRGCGAWSAVLLVLALVGGCTELECSAEPGGDAAGAAGAERDAGGDVCAARAAGAGGRIEAPLAAGDRGPGHGPAATARRGPQRSRRSSPCRPTRTAASSGMALSGGGSRSANFAAACMFQLERFGLLQRVDYISSVSGGSLAGAYYCVSGDRRLEPGERAASS